MYMKMYENIWKCMKIYQNVSKYTKIISLSDWNNKVTLRTSWRSSWSKTFRTLSETRGQNYLHSLIYRGRSRALYRVLHIFPDTSFPVDFFFNRQLNLTTKCFLHVINTLKPKYTIFEIKSLSFRCLILSQTLVLT